MSKRELNAAELADIEKMLDAMGLVTQEERDAKREEATDVYNEAFENGRLHGQAQRMLIKKLGVDYSNIMVPLIGKSLDKLIADKQVLHNLMAAIHEVVVVGFDMGAMMKVKSEDMPMYDDLLADMTKQLTGKLK